DSKKAEDAALAAFISKDAGLKKKYGTLLSDIDALYSQIFADADREMWLSQIHTSTSMLNVSRQLNAFRAGMDQSSDKAAFFQQNLPRLKQMLGSIYGSYHFTADSIILNKMLADGFALPTTQSITALEAIENPTEFSNVSLAKLGLTDHDYVIKKHLKSP